MQPYKVPANTAQSEFVERRSRFIGQVWPVSSYEQVQQILAELRRQHYQARHVVHAVRLQQGSLVRFSDDGEPQGTAGPPLLELLQRADLTDCLVTVVRYFGGVLLGTGGLVRAYTQAGQQALQQAGEIWQVPAIETRLHGSYAAYGRLAAFPAQFGGTVGETEYSDEVIIPTVIPSCCKPFFCNADIWRETGSTVEEWKPTEPLRMTAEIFENWKEKFT